VRDDGMTQVEAAHLLGRHKSWVCRRLALLDKLSVEVKQDLCLGLLGPSLARQLTRLPACNQEAVLSVTRRETLTAPEVSGLIDLLQGASPEQAAFVLAKPREALRHARGVRRRCVIRAEPGGELAGQTLDAGPGGVDADGTLAANAGRAGIDGRRSRDCAAVTRAPGR